MSGSVIDLSLTPFPDAIEALDYETLLAQRKADLIAKNPAIADVLAVESEPLTMLLEEDAYREMLLRQAINDRTKAVSLAHASGATLEALCAWRNIQRLELVPGDANAVPPVAPVMESDTELRRRFLLSFSGESVAGPAGSYAFHALSAHADVTDVAVESPTPCEVDVLILSRVGTGVPSQGVLDTVLAALNAQTVRPIGDRVNVLAATIVDFTVDATLTVYPGPDSSVVQAEAEARLATYLAKHHKLGHDITRSGILAALHVEGVQNVTLTAPANDIVITAYEAAYASAITVSTGATNV